MRRRERVRARMDMCASVCVFYVMVMADMKVCMVMTD